MLPPEELELLLLLLRLEAQPEYGGHADDAQEHVSRVGKAHQAEDGGGGRQVVGLVVEQVVDDAAQPAVLVAHVWHLEARLAQQEVVQGAQWGQFQRGGGGGGGGGWRRWRRRT